MQTFKCPIQIKTDAYQAGHFKMIPPGMENFECSQGIFRKPLHYGGDTAADLRIVSAGLMPFILLNLEEPITPESVDEAEWFYNDFHAKPEPPFVQPYPYPKKIFEKIISEFNGKLPICVMGLKDGQTHYVGEPHVQIWTDVPGMGELVGWIESTLGPYLWTSATVATRGRIRVERFMELYQKCYPSRSRDDIKRMVTFKFHDFGRRGAASSQITGIAHLINWLGTDTVDAAYAATKFLNRGKKFGANSILAAAHRTITPWETEDAAYKAMIDFSLKYQIFAIVLDSYNYSKGLEKVSQYAEIIKTNNATLIGRPDSGDPTTCVLEGLETFGKAFGYTTQENGLKVLNNCGIIQGDGVSDRKIFEDILPAVATAGWCPSNVAFGMGEYNHRAVRSDMEWAYKTCLVGTSDGYREVMKGSENRWKKSIPGPVGINLKSAQKDRIYSVGVEQLKNGETGDFVVLYDGRKNPLPTQRETFEETRNRAYYSWDKLSPMVGDTFHPGIRELQKEYLEKMDAS